MTKELEEVIGLGRSLSATMDAKSGQAQDIHSQMFAGLKQMITQQETQVGFFSTLCGLRHELIV